MIDPCESPNSSPIQVPSMSKSSIVHVCVCVFSKESKKSMRCLATGNAWGDQVNHRTKSQQDICCMYIHGERGYDIHLTRRLKTYKLCLHRQSYDRCNRQHHVAQNHFCNAGGPVEKLWLFSVPSAFRKGITKPEHTRSFIRIDAVYVSCSTTSKSNWTMPELYSKGTPSW